MSERFKREGMGYRFAPAEVPAVLYFSRPADHRDEITFEVALYTPTGQRVLSRRINLLAGTTRGSVKDLMDELQGEVSADWRKLLREACESVLASHRAGPPVRVVRGEIQRPPPPAWLCDGLLLKDKPNCWFGAGSTGKSTLAKAVCAYYASGYRFLDRPMEQGVPLYLDWEDDEDSFRRVVHDVCRNLGVWPLPLMLWRDMHGQRLRDQVESLARVMDQYHVGLIVLDAIAAAGGSPGEHMTWESVALELEQSLGQLPPVTVLALDHVTSEDRGSTIAVPLKARGAERKREYFRNLWALQPDLIAQDHGRHLVAWTNTKLNVAMREPPFVTEIVYRDAEIGIVVRELEASGDAMERLTELQKLLRYVQQTPAQTVSEIALAIYGSTGDKRKDNARVESVRTQLKRARARDLAWDDAAGRWYARQEAVNGQVIPFPGGSA